MNLGSSRVSATTGNITASNCIISGGVITGGYAAIVAAGSATSVNFTSTTVTGCTATDSDKGGALRVADGAVGTFIDCVFTGNADSRNRGPALCVEYLNASATLSNCVVDQTIQAGSFGTVVISGGSVETLGVWGESNYATFVLAGSVSVKEVDNMYGSYNKVVISSGANITLTHYIFHNAKPAAIEVKTGGCVVNGHTINAGNYTWIKHDGTYGQ